jgi:outer membrane autotransporter protein
MTAARAALFGPLYSLPPGSLGAALDTLAPTIYADGLITARNSWYLVADAIGEQLAARRGLAVGPAGTSAPGPGGSRIWAGGLAGYNGVGAAGGAPGFTAGSGGTAAGIDVPVAGTARLGVAVGAVHAQTWAQAGGQATADTTQFVTYGAWLRGGLFAEAQLGLMYLQQDVHRSMAPFGASARGDNNGLASGGGLRLGTQQPLGPWLVEPSMGFGGFGLHVGHTTESTAGSLAQSIGGASLGSAQSTLAVSARRSFAAGPGVRVTAKVRLGWSHEFADDAARIAASFTGLTGSGFALNSAPIGRDAALAGLGADIKVASWPLTVFVGYGGAMNVNSNAQSVTAGLDFLW